MKEIQNISLFIYNDYRNVHNVLYCLARSYLEGTHYLNCNNYKNAFIFLPNMSLDINSWSTKQIYALLKSFTHFRTCVKS